MGHIEHEFEQESGSTLQDYVIVEEADVWSVGFLAYIPDFWKTQVRSWGPRDCFIRSEQRSGREWTGWRAGRHQQPSRARLWRAARVSDRPLQHREKGEDPGSPAADEGAGGSGE